ncbi:MAG: AtpZ/AtpI family protein [Phycisphaerae bacterium]
MKKDQPVKDPKRGGARAAFDRLERHASELAGSSSTPAAGQNLPALRASGLRRFTSMGVEFLAVVLIFGLIGQWVDHQFQWHGVATVVLICVAVIGDLYLQIKMLLQSDEHTDIKAHQALDSKASEQKDTHVDN